MAELEWVQDAVSCRVVAAHAHERVIAMKRISARHIAASHDGSKHGGTFVLMQFAPDSGMPTEIAELPQAAMFAFYRKGSRLISSDCRIWDVATGAVCDSITLQAEP